MTAAADVPQTEDRHIRRLLLVVFVSLGVACTDGFNVGDAGGDAPPTSDGSPSTDADRDAPSQVGDGPLRAAESCEDYPATTVYVATFEDEEPTGLFVDRGTASIEEGVLTVVPGETSFGEPLVLVQLRDRFARLAVCADIVDSGASGRFSIAAKQFAEGATCVVDRDEQVFQVATVASGLVDVVPIPWLRPNSALRIGATHDGDRVRCELLDVETQDYAQIELTLVEPLREVGLELIARGEGVSVDTLTAGLPR